MFKVVPIYGSGNQQSASAAMGPGDRSSPELLCRSVRPVSANGSGRDRYPLNSDGITDSILCKGFGLDRGDLRSGAGLR